MTKDEIAERAQAITHEISHACADAPDDLSAFKTAGVIVDAALSAIPAVKDRERVGEAVNLLLVRRGGIV